VASGLTSRRWGRWLQDGWWLPAKLSKPSLWIHQALTRPLAALLRVMLGDRNRLITPCETRAEDLGVPVLVVGNLVVGGAGKTPTVLALVRALQQRGWHPGVISRGYGAVPTQGDAVRAVRSQAQAAEVGDEPALMARSLPGVPVFVGRQRRAAARTLRATHPEVDVIISDDGLQHRDLPRQVQLIVFDERGAGNERLLPAGPLRQSLPRALPDRTWLVYNAPSPSTPLPGICATRSLSPPQAWRDWAEGQAPSQPAGAAPLEDASPGTNAAVAAEGWRAWRGRIVTAMAGIGHPQRFFDMLRAQGVTVKELPLPDHADLQNRPWHTHPGPIVMTAKDAIKVLPDDPDADRLWVVSLDFALPNELIDRLERSLRAPQSDSTR